MKDIKIKEERTKRNPYESCPVYESQNYIYRMVEEKDAIDLLECYSNLEATKFFNSDNCNNNFIYNTLEEMEECINFWLEQYRDGYYIRLSIIDKKSLKAIGTIEFFAKKIVGADIEKVGVLRLDLVPERENETAILEMLEMMFENFYEDFEIEHIITKAIPEAKERIKALEKAGFKAVPDRKFMTYDHYFIAER